MQNLSPKYTYSEHPSNSSSLLKYPARDATDAEPYSCRDTIYRDTRAAFTVTSESDMQGWCKPASLCLAELSVPTPRKHI